MAFKNYRYNRHQGKTFLQVIKTPQMLSVVKSIDEKFLQDTLVGQDVLSNNKEGWIGKCPFCKSRRDKYKSYKPACLIAGRDEGYVFYCCSCGLKMTTYKFLLETQGLDTAEQYAQERWDAGELCGGGWNCPLPQKIRDRLLSEKAQRREEYRRAEQERKARNYQRKYGSSSTESD